jgi:hypothetical protein
MKKNSESMGFKNIAGCRFGKLLVIDVSEKRDDYGQIYWNCLCECGNSCVVRGTSLRNGHTVSCGCVKTGIDETGNQYGELLVVGRAARTHSSIHWECLCSCGEVVVIRGDILRRGTILSCGCESKRRYTGIRHKDETGNRYHKLVVVGLGERKDDGIYWDCSCDCGNKAMIKGYLLRSGQKTSCGCEQEALDQDNQVKVGEKYGWWTVRALSSRRGKNGGRYWDCTCECGTERAVAETNLKSGYSRACGCTRKSGGDDKAFIDETNNKYGKLTVINRNTEKRDKTYWNCLCECGQTIAVRGDILRSKNPPESCGCTKIINEVGNVYGKLTVESLDRVVGSERVWRCRCACGNIANKRGSDLRSGRTQACSLFCFKRDSFVETSFNQLIGIARRSAKLRKLEYSLSREEHVLLVKSNCYYCGALPSNELKTTRTKKLKMKYSGIDRIDPTKGYVPGNVRPCCVDCNKAKLDRTTEEFFFWVSRVHKTLQGRGLITGET